MQPRGGRRARPALRPAHLRRGHGLPLPPPLRRARSCPACCAPSIASEPRRPGGERPAPGARPLLFSPARLPPRLQERGQRPRRPGVHPPGLPPGRAARRPSEPRDLPVRGSCGASPTGWSRWRRPESGRANETWSWWGRAGGRRRRDLPAPAGPRRPAARRGPLPPRQGLRRGHLARGLALSCASWAPSDAVRALRPHALRGHDPRRPRRHRVHRDATGPDRAGLAVRRAAFDQPSWRWPRAAGVEVREGARVTRPRPRGGRVSAASGATGHGRESVAARLVVAADGRRSLVARQLGLLSRAPPLPQVRRARPLGGHGGPRRRGRDARGRRRVLRHRSPPRRRANVAFVLDRADLRPARRRPRSASTARR